MIHTKWFRLVVIIVFLVAGGFFLKAYNQVDKPQLVNTDGMNLRHRPGSRNRQG